MNNNNVTDGLEVSCNANCSCQGEYFIPVCGADNINYFTACHAGCFQSEVINDTRVSVSFVLEQMATFSKVKNKYSCALHF